MLKLEQPTPVETKKPSFIRDQFNRALTSMSYRQREEIASASEAKGKNDVEAFIKEEDVTKRLKLKKRLKKAIGRWGGETAQSSRNNSTGETGMGNWKVADVIPQALGIAFRLNAAVHSVLAGIAAGQELGIVPEPGASSSLAAVETIINMPQEFAEGYVDFAQQVMEILTTAWQAPVALSLQKTVEDVLMVTQNSQSPELIVLGSLGLLMFWTGGKILRNRVRTASYVDGVGRETRDKTDALRYNLLRAEDKLRGQEYKVARYLHAKNAGERVFANDFDIDYDGIERLRNMAKKLRDNPKSVEFMGFTREMGNDNRVYLLGELIESIISKSDALLEHRKN